MSTEDVGELREMAETLKDETSTLHNNISRLDMVDNKQISNAHPKQYYS